MLVPYVESAAADTSLRNPNTIQVFVKFSQPISLASMLKLEFAFLGSLNVWI